MLKIQKGFFDRFDQSFKILRGNFLLLTIPIIAYNLIALIFFQLLMLLIGGNFLNKIINNPNNKEEIYNILSDPNFIILIVLGITTFIMYALFYVIALLTTIRNIKAVIYKTDNNKINLQKEILNSVKYGFTNFFNSFKVYWYIFAYVMLIPSLVFIFSGIILIYGLYINNETISIISYFSFGITLILFLVFSIYRGTKAKFGLYSAIETNNYKNDGFKKSLKISNGKVALTFWNIFGIGALVGVVLSTFKSAISQIIFISSGGATMLISTFSKVIDGKNINDIMEGVKQFMLQKSFFYDIIGSITSIIINITGEVFVIIFIYLLYLRLLRENEFEQKNKIKEKIEF